MTVAPLVTMASSGKAAPVMGATTPADAASPHSTRPRLSDALAPSSTIAAPQFPLPAPRSRDARLLVVSMPDAAPITVPTIRNRVAVPLARAPRVISAQPAPKNLKPVAPVVAAKTENLTAVAVVSPAPDALGFRPKGARLPARGGLISKPSTVQLRPERNISPAVSDSQRLLLARLDADLAQAQRRLNRAESRLSEGQKQLGSATGLLRSAMLDAGVDARGLNPFVRVAQRYLGTPYVWGGESARGFDCSGFIMRVMRDLGYQALPHSAAEQFRYGTPVAKELLKAGDIVFFANTYKKGISHVGIYLGRGRFIHAANSQDGTIVSSLYEPKWVEKYAGARRLVNFNS